MFSIENKFSTIKKKIKDIKYQYLKKLYKKYLNKSPQNCKYNKILKLPNGSEVPFCSFNIENLNTVDLCYKKEHCDGCNAFCFKYNKEDIRKDFLKELNDPNIRATKYKDLNVFYWLFHGFDEEVLEPKNSIISRVISKIKSLFIY